MKYRAEIDGLRALTVVPVILFHAGFELFSGGFVGVDVFFVISGYLITTIILEDIENNRFSIVTFYERRARRILPALFFVILVCIPFAWIWMSPNQINEFSQSVIAVILFVPNILFWRVSGYFDSAAEEKPMIHTWSLGVEEQYYVLFPIFIFLAWRFGQNRVFWMIVGMAAISLMLSEWGWRSHPKANFYLAPTRAWELFAGSIAAFIVQKRGVLKSDVLALLGLAMVIFAVFVYDESTPFPSVSALVPVSGVVLLVLYADKETFAARILSTRVLVSIGLISYSAYLWHQPLFAFARIRLIEPSLSIMALLSFASILLAYFSWKYIEKPFRSGDLFGRLTIVIFFSLGFVALLALGLLGSNDKIITYASLKNDSLLEGIDKGFYGGKGFKKIAIVNNPEIVLVGDSHAKQYIGALREINPRTALFMEHNCLSLPNIINQNNEKNIERTKCVDLHKRYLSYVKGNNSVRTLVIAHRWGKMLFDLDTREVIGRAHQSNFAYLRFKDELDRFFVSLNELGINVVLVGNVPAAYVASDKMKKGYVDCNYRFDGVDCPKKYNRTKREGVWANELLEKLSGKFDSIQFLDPADALCDENDCWVVKNNRLIYSDHAHLTIHGARIVTEFLESNYFHNE